MYASGYRQLYKINSVQNSPNQKIDQKNTLYSSVEIPIDQSKNNSKLTPGVRRKPARGYALTPSSQILFPSNSNTS